MRPVRTIVSISGSAFSATLLRAEVVETVFRHESVRMILNHSFRKEQEEFVTDLAGFVGESVKLEVADQTKDSGAEVILFEGFVTRAALGYEPGGLQLELEAASGSANLDQVPCTRIFQETTLQEILEKVIADYKGSSIQQLSIKLGPLGQKRISFAAQWGETDWDFLLRLCRKFGLVLVARNKDLHIQTGESFEALASDGGAGDLHLGNDLTRFRLGLQSVNQSSKASSYQPFSETGLDSGKGDKAEDVRVWAGPSGAPQPTNTLAQMAAGRTWGNAVEGNVVELDDHFSQQEFDAISKRWQIMRASQLVAGSGECDALGLGLAQNVHIAATETREFNAFAGDEFLIKECVHKIDGGVYTLQFEVGAGGAPPLLDPAGIGNEPDFRLLSGTVTESFDSSNLGRVKVRLNPFANDDLIEDIPMRCLNNSSGEFHGTLDLPEISDEVLVALDPRSFSAPTVLGSAYNGTNKSLVDNLPEQAGVDSGMMVDNNVKYFLSKAGTCIVHDTSDGSARLIVTTPNMSLILSENDGVDIHVRGSGGECQITGTPDGNLSLTATNITIEADQKLTLKSGTDLEIDAGTNAKVKAAMNYEMEAGMEATEKAGMKFEVDGGISLKMKAALVEIN